MRNSSVRFHDSVIIFFFSFISFSPRRRIAIGVTAGFDVKRGINTERYDFLQCNVLELFQRLVGVGETGVGVGGCF